MLIHQLSLYLELYFCVLWEGLEFYKDSHSNDCHRNIGFLICQFGNIPARLLSPSTLNMTMQWLSAPRTKSYFCITANLKRQKDKTTKKETERQKDIETKRHKYKKIDKRHNKRKKEIWQKLSDLQRKYILYNYPCY